MKKKNLLMTTIAIFGLATITTAQIPSYVPTNGLIGWWPFNGNANDESGNGYNGTVNGATLTSDRNGNTNSAYSFDGVNDKIPTSIMPSLNDFSFNVFFQIQSTNGYYKRLVDIDNASQSYLDLNVTPDNTASVQFRVNNIQYNFVSTSQLNDTNWHCITFARNNDFGYFYLDGILSDTQFITNSPFYANALLTFGHTDLGGYPEQFFYGKIDDIGIWNRYLTQEEITSLYNGCQLSINDQPTNQTININNNAQFVISSSDPNSTFQWQTDLGVGFQNLNSVGQYSGTTNDTLIVSNVTISNNNQPFRCIVNSGSCSDTSDVAMLTVNNNVGINETSQDKLFSVFPNPAQSVINVKADSKLIGEIYTIYDNTGRVVLSGKLNSQNTTIELGNLLGGIYMFSIGDNMKQTFKVIKE